MATDDYDTGIQDHRFNNDGNYSYHAQPMATSSKPTSDNSDDSDKSPPPPMSSDYDEVIVVACIITVALLVIIVMLAICFCFKKHYLSAVDNPELTPNAGGGAEVAPSNETTIVVAGSSLQPRRYQPLPVVPQILSALNNTPDTQSAGGIAHTNSSSLNKPESSKINKTRVPNPARKRKSTIGGGRKGHRRSQYQLQQQQQKQKSQIQLDRSAPITAEMFNPDSTNNISTKGEEVILFKALSFNE